MNKAEKDVSLEIVDRLRRISQLSSSNVTLMTEIKRNADIVLDNSIGCDKLYK